MSFQKHTYFKPLLLATLLSASSAFADTVWLNNGDRLTGTIKSLDAGYLVIETVYSGNVRINFSEVKTLASNTELVVRDASLQRDYRAKLVAAEAGTVTLNGVARQGDATESISQPVALNSIRRVVRPRPFLNEASFSGRIDLAASQKFASTDTKDYTLDSHAQLRHGMWRHRLGADYTRSREDNTDSTYNYGAGYSLDYFISRKAFWQGRVSYRRDQVEDLTRQVSYGTGPGYQFWDDELGSFSVSALLNRVHYKYKDGYSEDDYAASLRWDYVRYFMGQEIELYTRGEVLRSFNGETDFAINGEVGTRYNVNSTLSLYLKYARHQVSGSRSGLNQSIYSTGLGIKW